MTDQVPPGPGRNRPTSNFHLIVSAAFAVPDRRLFAQCTRLLAAAEPLHRQLGEILRPQPLSVAAQRLQIGPCVEAGIVAVVEYDPDGVAPDGAQVLDPDVA